MKKILLLALVVALAIFSFAVTKEGDGPKEPEINSNILENTRIDSKNGYRTVRIGGEEFRAIVSDTAELRERGLSGRNGLESDEAMLFIFETPDRVGFWMKDMLFSIDIMWVDEDFKVVSFEKNVSPETFPKVFYPKAPALYVLEFSAGTLDRLQVKEGDLITL